LLFGRPLNILIGQIEIQVQIFDENVPISGIRLSLIYGRSVSVTGLDWGLVNHTTSGKSVGVQFGLVGIADADFMGWQDNWVNAVKGNSKDCSGER
jgi:hypothetical protein